MITGLPKPKTTYLLDAGFDVLHHESQEWLATIAFWKYELRFFAEVLYWKEPILYWKEPKESDDAPFQGLLDRFETIHSLVTIELEDEVMQHEKYLAGLMRNEKGSNWEYRDTHEKISTNINPLFEMVEFNPFNGFFN